MSQFRGQDKLDGRRLPIVVNVMNFAQGRRRRDEPLELRRRAHALPRVRPRAARHAVGRRPIRACRARMSRPTSSSFPRSFTSTGSSSRRCCSRFALHYQTGEPMPEALIEQAHGGAPLQPGLRDRRVHGLGAGRHAASISIRRQATSTSSRSSGRNSTGSACRRRSRMRHRTPHFQHIFSGGYSAAYYSYLWSEVLDADGFEAFEESARHLRSRRRQAPPRLRLFGRRQPRLRARPIAPSAAARRRPRRCSASADSANRRMPHKARHCAKRSDEAIDRRAQTGEELLRFVRNDGRESVTPPAAWPARTAP